MILFRQSDSKILGNPPKIANLQRLIQDSIMKKTIYFLMAALIVLVAASCSKLLDTDDLSSGDAEGYVDMGLSVKWKNRNAGAGQPNQVAEYYTFQDMKKYLS